MSVTMSAKMMPMSNYFMTENILAQFNTCRLQQANSPYLPYPRTTHIKTLPSGCSKSNSSIIDNEQMKIELIQAATNRLRQKRLEVKFQAIMTHIVDMQCQLDIIKMDTSISLQLLSSSNISETQLAHFEKRLANHKVDLQRILECKEDTKAETSSPSLASCISPLLSLCSNSDKDDAMMQEESDYSILGGSIHDHQKRRKRRHNNNHQKKQHESIKSNIATTTSSMLESAYASLDAFDNSNESISCSYYNDSILVQPLHELLVLHSINVKEDRNALDDVLSFLNGIASDNTKHDDGFIQDIYDILHQQQNQPHSAVAVFRFQTVKYLLSRGLKWIKFAIVMALAIMINLKKGPKSFL